MSSEPKTILLVEEVSILAEQIGNALKPCRGNFSLAHEKTLAGARSFLSKNLPDLTLCNAELPDGEGAELLPGNGGADSCPIIIYSTKGKTKEAVKMVKAGAVNYFELSEGSLKSLPQVIQESLEEWRLKIEKKQQLAELRESRDRYRKFFRSAPISLWDEDWYKVKEALDSLAAKGVTDFRKYFEENPEFVKSAAKLVKIREVNETTRRIYRIKTNQKVLIPFDEIDDEYYDLIKQQLLAISDCKSLFVSEGFNRTQEGEPMHVLISMAIPDEKEDFRNILVCIFDITKQKKATKALFESESRNKAMVQALPDPVLVMSGDGEYIDFQGGDDEKLFMPRNQILGTNIRDIGISKENTERLLLQLKKALQTGKVQTETYEFREPKDLGFWEVRAKAMNETNVLIISRDISESVKAERERVEMEAQLLQSQKMETIGTLAGGIAHDFNNILQAIRGYVDMAREEIPAHSPAQEDLEHVTRAVSRAKNLVRQILTFSRQSAQDFKVIAIQNIIREAVEMLRAIVPSQIEIECRLQEDCGPVHADPTQIQQVVINLCNNASQSMLPDGGFITIELDAFVADADFASLHADMQPGSFARITISDTGHGMDAVTLPRIFEPFFTTKNVGEGTGLGLSVVHGIVANHKGSIIVQSEPEHGSTFQIFLPFASTTAIKDKELKTSPKERPRKNILFVDDDEAVAQLGKKILDKAGYTATALTSGVKALESFRKNPLGFDLVITDQVMPGITGKEMARKMLRIRQDIPIILSTGFSASVSPEKMRNTGIRDIIYKPFLPSELLDKIRHILKSETSFPVPGDS